MASLIDSPVGPFKYHQTEQVSNQPDFTNIT
jgi:hypothetical protein